MSGADRVRSLGGFFSRLGAARQAAERPPEAGSRRTSEESPVVNSKALARFLSYLGSCPAPVLLDLGPVVGSNVAFFGEQLNCKIHIEDIGADLDRHLREGRIEELPEFFSKRFTLEKDTVDGVLLWDSFDYLDRKSAQALAAAIVPLVRDGGALFGYFGNASQNLKGFRKFIVSDGSHVRQLSYGSMTMRHTSLPNRDIIKMFDGVGVSDSFLLQNGLREILFRKGIGGRPII